MENLFKKISSSKDKGTFGTGEKYQRLEKNNDVSRWKSPSDIISKERVNQEKGRYKEFKKFNLYDGDDELENLKKFPRDTINFINTCKDKMIKGNILTKDEFQTMMKTFQDRVDGLNKQVELLRDALKNGASPSAGLRKPHVKQAYQEVAQSAQAFLEKVDALATAQQQEQIQQTGTYQPSEFS